MKKAIKVVGKVLAVVYLLALAYAVIKYPLYTFGIAAIIGTPIVLIKRKRERDAKAKADAQMMQPVTTPRQRKGNELVLLATFLHKHGIQLTEYVDGTSYMHTMKGVHTDGRTVRITLFSQTGIVNIDYKTVGRI